MQKKITILLFVLLLPVLLLGQTFQVFNEDNSDIYLNSAYWISFDSQGGIWISSLRDAISFTAVSYLAPDLTTWTIYQDDQLFLNGDNRVRVMNIDIFDNKWLATRTELSLIKADGTIMQVDSLEGKVCRGVHSDSAGNVYVSVRDAESRIWMTGDLGVTWPQKWSAADIGLAASAASAAEIYDLEYDSRGNMWICTHYGVTFRDNQDQWYSIPELDGEFTNVMTIDANDNVWIPDGGSNAVWQILPDTTVVTHDNPLGLSTAAITDITTDTYGNIWFVTDGEGIFKMGPSLRHITVTSTGGEMPEDELYVVAAQDSVVWAQTAGLGTVRISDILASIETEQPQSVSGYALHDNYPNPFNPSTKIAFDLAQPGLVTVSVFDLQGRLVQTLTSQKYTSGTHTVQWNGTDIHGSRVASGVYLYHISADNFSMTKKMVLLK